MPCLNRCCPPYPYMTDRDPTGDDCRDSVIPGQEDAGGFCPGSRWYNTVTKQWFIGVNDMACNNAQWMATNPILTPLAHVATHLGTAQVIPTATTTRLYYYDELNDTNNDYDPVTAVFTAPRDGAYLVQAHVMIGSSNGWEEGDRITIDGLVNGTVVFVLPGATYNFHHSDGVSRTFDLIEVAGTRTIHLTAGMTVWFRIWHNNNGSITLNDSGSIMSIDEIPLNGLFY